MTEKTGCKCARIQMSLRKLSGGTAQLCILQGTFPPNQESPTFFKLRATYWYRFMQRATKYQFDTQTSEIKICLICFQLCYH